MSPTTIAYSERGWYRYREQDWLNRKQRVLVPVPVSDQCQHFYMVLYQRVCSTVREEAVYLTMLSAVTPTL